MKSKVYYDHCNTEIKDFHSGYHRKGYHYCTYLCWKDDDGCKPSRLKPINRKSK